MLKAIFFLLAAVAVVSGAGMVEGSAASPGCLPEAAQSSAATVEYAPGHLLLAKMIEKDDHILYRTDFAEPKNPRDPEREEKEKEERSWEMLDRMEIFQYRGKPDRFPREDRRQ